MRPADRAVWTRAGGVPDRVQHIFAIAAYPKPAVGKAGGVV